MSVINLFLGATTEEQNGTVVSRGTTSSGGNNASPIVGYAAIGEEGQAIKIGIRCPDGEKSGSSIVLSSTSDKWAFAPDNHGSPGTYGDYGAGLTLTPTTGTDYSSAENVSGDATVSYSADNFCNGGTATSIKSESAVVSQYRFLNTSDYLQYNFSEQKLFRKIKVYTGGSGNVTLDIYVDGNKVGTLYTISGSAVYEYKLQTPVSGTAIRLQSAISGTQEIIFFSIYGIDSSSPAVSDVNKIFWAKCKALSTESSAVDSEGKIYIAAYGLYFDIERVISQYKNLAPDHVAVSFSPPANSQYMSSYYISDIFNNNNSSHTLQLNNYGDGNGAPQSMYLHCDEKYEFESVVLKLANLSDDSTLKGILGLKIIVDGETAYDNAEFIETPSDGLLSIDIYKPGRLCEVYFYKALQYQKFKPDLVAQGAPSAPFSAGSLDIYYVELLGRSIDSTETVQSSTKIVANIRQRIRDEGKTAIGDDNTLITYINEAISWLNNQLISLQDPIMISETGISDGFSIPAGFVRTVGQYPIFRDGNTFKILNGATTMNIRYWKARPRIQYLSDSIDFPEQYYDVLVQYASLAALNKLSQQIDQDSTMLKQLNDLLVQARKAG